MARHERVHSVGRPAHFMAGGLVVAASLVACGCNPAASTAPPSAAAPEVAIVTVAPEPVLLTTTLPGRISAYLVAEIRPQVSGLIQKRLFEEGANVRADEVLYQIDPAPYQAALDQAKATLLTSEAELVTAEANLPAIRSRAQRLKELVAINAVSKQDFDDASAALRQAEANLAARKAAVEISRAAVESARINLSYTPIRSPITGRIGKSNITVGALATAHQPAALAVVQQLDPIYVDVVQSNAELLHLRRNIESGRLKRNGALQNRVNLMLEDGTPYPIPGTLQFRDVTVDPTTGSVTLRMVFPNPKAVLLPGMFVQAVVEEGLREQAILVPQQAVSRDPKGNPIALVVGSGGKAESRRLELERAIKDKWLVTSGLAAGDRLIVEGLERVRPGVEVRAVPAPGAPAAASETRPVSQPAAKGNGHV